jgi:hypothetical protein
MVRRIAPALAGAFVVALLVAFLFNGVTTAQETPPSPDLAPEADAASTFTYQGYLQQGGAPVNGTCDFQFRLYSALTGGTQIGSTLSFNREAVSQGRFTIEFNFGANPINGQGRWLQMAVRCPAGAGSFTTLTPRQVLTGTPFALSLLPGAGTTGTVASSGILNLSNSSTASGALGLNVALAPIGVQVGRASNNGLQVNSAGNNGLKVAAASNNGVQVDSAGENGLQVDSAGGNGVQVSSASGNGLLVDAAGAPSISYFSSLNDGVEVAGAQGHGFYLGRADQDGLRIRSTGDDAIQIGEGGVAPNYGVYAPAPGTPFITLLPNTANANGEWALYTTDWIYSATIGASANALVAVAAGDLAAGDVAAAAGLAGPLPDSLAPLVQVRAADGAAGIVGVVASRMELQPAPGKDGLLILHSVPGPAKAGDYVLLTTTGAAQVKVQDGSAIQPGQRVTVGGSGAVRGLETRTVEGMTVSEGAPTVGVALQAPQDGLVWVFVAPE